MVAKSKKADKAVVRSTRKKLAVVPEVKAETKPPLPETRQLPEKAAAEIKKLHADLQSREAAYRVAQRKLTDAVRLVSAAMGIDPDSRVEHWKFDPLTGTFTRSLP